MTTTKPPRPANKLQMRAFYTKKIEELLAQRGQLTRAQIADELGINDNTLSNYLACLRDLHGTVRPSGKCLNGRPMWELGQYTGEMRKCEPVVEMPVQRNTVPARQVGMFRHWMDVALFGPVQGACA